MKRLAAGVVLMVLVTGCSTGDRDSSGRVTAAATTDAFSIKVGDCTTAIGDDSVGNVTLMPCAQSHYWEAYATTTMEDASYPGATRITETGDQFCGKTFSAFVGVGTEKSKFRYTYLYPTEQTWTTTDDRVITCLVGSDTGGITGSLKGIKK